MNLKNVPDDDTYTKFNLAIPFFPSRLVPIYFNTEIVPALLPVHLTVGHGEQVLDAQRLAWRQLDDGDARRDVLVLRRPVRDDVVGRGPGEIGQSLDFHALLVQQAKRLQKEIVNKNFLGLMNDTQDGFAQQLYQRICYVLFTFDVCVNVNAKVKV